MDIKLDLTGMSFEQQKELLSIQKELIQLEKENINNKINNKVFSEREIRDDIRYEEDLDRRIWEDYINWNKEWQQVLRSDKYDYEHNMSVKRYEWIKKYGIDYKDKKCLSERDYYLNEYTLYGGIKMPKNIFRKEEQTDEFIDSINRIGTIMMDKLTLNNNFVSSYYSGLLSDEANKRFESSKVKSFYDILINDKRRWS